MRISVSDVDGQKVEILVRPDDAKEIAYALEGVALDVEHGGEP